MNKQEAEDLVKECKKEYVESQKSRPLNNEARDKLVNQIDALMIELTTVIKDELEAGLDMLGRARNSGYTESMKDVASLIQQATNKFDVSFAHDRVKMDALKGVSIMILESEGGL